MTSRFRKFNVFVPGDPALLNRLRWIDSVFYATTDNITADEVKRSLIHHDGYSSDIVVVAED